MKQDLADTTMVSRLHAKLVQANLNCGTATSKEDVYQMMRILAGYVDVRSLIVDDDLEDLPHEGPGL